MTDRADLIRERAYRLWEEDGRPHGQSDAYWFEAERRVTAETDDTDQVKVAPSPSPSEAPLDALPGFGDAVGVPAPSEPDIADENDGVANTPDAKFVPSERLPRQTQRQDTGAISKTSDD